MASNDKTVYEGDATVYEDDTVFDGDATVFDGDETVLEDDNATVYEDDDATKTASLTLNGSTVSTNYLVIGSNSNSETDADSNA